MWSSHNARIASASGAYVRRARLALLAGFALACDSTAGPSAAPNELWISATRLILTAGDTTRLGFTAGRFPDVSHSPGLGREPVIAGGGRWSSSDPAVVEIVPGGLITARSPGVAVISLEYVNTLDYQTLTDSALVFVVSPTDPAAAVFADIQAGGAHACARTATGLVYCWGSSWFGEIGTGDVRKFTATVSPARVPGLVDVVALGVGDRHSCALTGAGHVYCWGEEISPPNAFAPRPSPVRVGGETRFATVSVGGQLACGITIDARILCWGAGIDGLREVPNTAALTSLSVGYDHACGLSASGEAFCFGSNGQGQLGTNELTPRTAPSPVQTTLRFTQISSGLDYTCAIAVDAQAYCWGGGAQGKLGSGEQTTALVPVAVVGLADAAVIDAGILHTCAITVLGAAYCWGDDIRGAVGNGPTSTPNPTAADLIFDTPVPVLTDLPYAVISAGWGESTCALDQSGRAWCWGLNTVGQLGAGRHDLRADVQLRYVESPIPVRAVP